MRLTPMRFKEFTWPHNPEVYSVEYRRRIAVHQVPFGGCVMQELGGSYRVLKGEGVFAGEGAYQRFRELAEEGAGVLFITHDLGLARTVAHKVVVFREGQTVDEVPARCFQTGEGLTHPYSRALWRAMPENDFL